MIDKEARSEKRFPPEIEDDVKDLIKEKLNSQLVLANKPLFGIAGGACGGDILFHETCRELNIQSELYLALPKKEFINESVSFAGEPWIQRFKTLYNNLPVKILDKSKLSVNPEIKSIDINIWELSNKWMLNSAIKKSKGEVTLLALWNDQKGKLGGTENMVNEARNINVEIITIDISALITSKK
jgi:hypothetical protein